MAQSHGAVVDLIALYGRAESIPGGLLLWAGALRIAYAWRTVRGAVLLWLACSDWLPMAWQAAAARARLAISEAWAIDCQRMRELAGEGQA